MNKNKKIQKPKASDRLIIETLSQITGGQFCYLLKKLGISGLAYGRKVDPPYQTASGVWNFARKDQIPFKLIKPLIQEYDPHFLLALLKQKWNIE